VKILVIDDCEVSQELAKTIIEGLGHEYTAARSLSESHEKANEVDAVVLDIQLEDSHSLTISRHYKNTAKRPVAIWSATGKGRTEDDVIDKARAEWDLVAWIAGLDSGTDG